MSLLDSTHQVCSELVAAVQPAQCAQGPQTITDQQQADRAAQGLTWAPDGELEAAPFLEVEREEAEEPGVMANTRCGQGAVAIITPSLHWTVQKQQHLLLSREPFRGQNA